MKCAWQAYLGLLPLWLRKDVDRHGKFTLQETRLRLGYPPELVTSQGRVLLNQTVQREDLSFVINSASRYSPWAVSSSARGYLTAQGGHRVGICGETAADRDGTRVFREPTSVCVRVARDYPGIGKDAALLSGSILVLGPPGSGKTTLLRDIIREKTSCYGQTVAVVDERGEIFPRWQGTFCFPTGEKTDVISGCSKADGLDMLLRCMSPQVIAVDEITAEEDCDALIRSAWCGVKLIGTVHASEMEDLYRRPIYVKLLERKIFDYCIVLSKGRIVTQERLCV